MATNQGKEATNYNDVKVDQKNKNVAEEFCQETSFDGFKHVGNSALSPIERLIWLVIVCGAASGLMYQVFKSSTKLSSFPVNTKFSLKDKKQMDFPAITLCNINLFRSDRLSKLYGGCGTLMDTGLLQLRQLFPQMGITYEDKYVPLDNYYPGHMDLGEFIISNAHNLEDMLVKCTFNGEPCKANNFTPIITNYGVCYSYNTNLPAKEVNQAGQRKGLSLILNAQQKLYVAAPRESAGFKVLAHDIEEFPNMDDHGKELQTGTHVAFGLELTKFTALNGLYGNCVDMPEYTQEKCFLDCQTTYVVEHCNCRTYYMSADAPYCSPIQLVECVYKAIDDFNIARDECKCEPACKQNVYQASLSQSTYPSFAVPNVLAVSKKWHFVALGFGEKVTLTAYPLFVMELNDELDSVNDAIPNLTNSEGVTFLEFTSLDVVTRFQNATTKAIFRNVPYDMYDSMGDKLFYDVAYDQFIDQGSYEYIGPGSQYYWEQVELSFKNYVNTSILWDILYESLSAGYTAGPIGNAYVLYVYEQFGFEDFFYEAFNFTFCGVYSLMKDVAERDVLPTLDLTGVATEYMRSNLVHVDIFYEELKVTTIEDQAGYELFQFICDIGGALGLFFGASLISFIELFALFTTKNRKIVVTQDIVDQK